MNNFMYEKYWRVKHSLYAFDGTGYRHKESVNIYKYVDALFIHVL